MKFKPTAHNEKLKIINEEGTVGIITLWTKPIIIEKLLIENCPELFEESSKIVTISSLYGNGFSQMMANLANNPQITKIAVIGEDIPIARSYDYLNNFFTLGVEEEEIAGNKMLRIKNTDLLIDNQIKPEIFSYIKLKRFRENEIEQFLEFINEKEINQSTEEDRIKIELPKIKFKKFTSDLTSHNILANSPIEAWMDVVYHLNKFGKDIDTKKGFRRTIFNLDVNIKDPSFDDENDLKEFGFDVNHLRDYQKEILEANLGLSLKYSYGNRIRQYWGGDALEKVSEMLKEDPTNRHCLISLWDTNKDLLKRDSSPCLTDIYFVIEPENKLMLSASFRTHNAISAWLPNVYGLRAIQEKVAKDIGIEPGQINIRSRWASISKDDPKTQFLLDLIDKKRNIRLNVTDPKGYFTLDVNKDENEIIVYWYNPQGLLIEEIRGKNWFDVKNKVRQKDLFSNSDHALFFGIELARAQKELTGDIPKI
jgi:thymidylate synthase